MTPDLALSLSEQMLVTALIIAAPILAVALVVGLLISIFQVMTQIQEMTLTFVPKILAVVGTLLLVGHWMLSTLIEYARTLFLNIPTMF